MNTGKINESIAMGYSNSFFFSVESQMKCDGFELNLIYIYFAQPPHYQQHPSIHPCLSIHLRIFTFSTFKWDALLTSKFMILTLTKPIFILSILRICNPHPHSIQMTLTLTKMLFPFSNQFHWMYIHKQHYHPHHHERITYKCFTSIRSNG